MARALVQDCATGYPNSIKDSFANCDSREVNDQSEHYCRRAFGRAFVSKREVFPAASLSTMSKKLQENQHVPRHWIHTCGHFYIEYKDQNGGERHYEYGGHDHMAIGKNCDDVESDMKNNPDPNNRRYNHHLCVWDEPVDTNKACPDGRTDITPFRGVYYNAGSTAAPIQYHIKICQCKRYQANDGRCIEQTGGLARREYYDDALKEYGGSGLYDHNLYKYHGRSRGTLSDTYYHSYGEYDHYNANNILIFAMSSMIMIGICCLFIIIALFCGFVSGKVYEQKNNKQSKHNRDEYDTDQV